MTIEEQMKEYDSLSPKMRRVVFKTNLECRIKAENNLKIIRNAFDKASEIFLWADHFTKKS